MKRGILDAPPKVDAARLNHYPLSSEIIADLTDAFKYYDKDDTGIISTTHFRNILHNFGFHKMTKKEIDELDNAITGVQSNA